MSSLRLPIVVGADGSEDSYRALRYAVGEAHRHDCGLRIIHVIHETVPMSPMLPLVGMDTLHGVGQQIVSDAASYVEGLDPVLEVETVVQPGSRSIVLSDAGKTARMIVLGHHRHTTVGRLLTHSTVHGVAARAHCPVVNVPAGCEERPRYRRVVVGVDGSRPSDDALAHAFGLAFARGAKLVVLHAWRLPSAYEDIIAERVMLEDWKESAGTQIAKLLAPWQRVYPDVDVEVVLRHEQPAAALVNSTADADVVVVGRRGHGGPLGVYLGSIARALVREAPCPAVIVPHPPRDVAERAPHTASEATPRS
jgi:nucleotide-binding universal stress UspA family protein